MLEVALVSDASGEKSCLSLWDLSTGVLVKGFKNGVCAKNAYGFVRDEYIISAQNGKQLIHIYDADNERLVKKIVCPDKISCLAMSPDGNYCVVALMEKIFIWQISTGNLIKVLTKHYQEINVIKFTQDGSYFISCGNDNLVLVWNFPSVCQPKDDLSDNSPDKPVHSLSHHSLPVVDLYVGVGGCRCHVATCSLDQTCKLYDLTSGKMLCSFIFDYTCSSVTMDITERQLFAGTSNGRIYFVNLYAKDREKAVHSKEGALLAHSKEVSSLSVSLDACTLLSASLDCSVKLWHISSRQCFRTFSFKGEITNAVILPLPSFLRAGHTPPKMKRPVGNFQRTVYTPFSQLADFNSMKSDEVIPVMLKSIDMKVYDRFMLPETAHPAVHDSVLEKALHECFSENVITSNSTETATRAELIQRVNTLEAIASEFYTLASNRIINDE